MPNIELDFSNIECGGGYLDIYTLVAPFPMMLSNCATWKTNKELNLYKFYLWHFYLRDYFL